MKKFWLLTVLACLAGCGEDRPPAPSAEQAEQLDEAENLLNEAADSEGNDPQD